MHVDFEPVFPTIVQNILCHVHRDNNELLGILLDEGTDSHVESKSGVPTKRLSTQDDRATLSFELIGKAFKIDDEKDPAILLV